MSFREACWNMGATRWQTIRTIVLPNSISGILTGVILQVSRAAGETAPILLTGAVFFVPRARPRLGVVLPLRPARQLHGPIDAPVHAGHASPRRFRRNPIRHRAGADRPGIGRQQPVDRPAGLPAVAEEMVKMAAADAHIRFENVTVAYGAKTSVEDVSLEIPEKCIFAIIGPANSGKTTLLRCINRTIDFIPKARVRGRVLIDGEDVFRLRNVYQLRRRVGMVFPLPVGLPLSVYENVAYGPRRAGIHDRGRAGRDRRDVPPPGDALGRGERPHGHCWAPGSPAASSSGSRWPGRSRCEPEILCLDEFSIAIDPVTTMRIEDILRELKERDDHRAGHEPGAAGPAAGRLYRLLQRLAADRGRRNRNDIQQGRQSAHGTVYYGGFRMMSPLFAGAGCR